MPPRVYTLRYNDFFILARIFIGVCLLKLVQKHLSLPDLVRLFDSRPRAKSVDVDRLFWLTNGVLRRIYIKDFCMPRSLVLFHLLRRSQVEASIHFGVKKEQEDIKGHAWIEHHGSPLHEKPDVNSNYNLIYCFPKTV